MEKWGRRRCRRPFPLPGAPPSHVEDTIVHHATAIVTGPAAARSGPPAALPAAEGFRDMFHIRDEHRCDTADPRIQYADSRCRARAPGISGRAFADRNADRPVESANVDGNADRPAGSANIDSPARHLRGANVDPVAICLLDAGIDGGNERRSRQAERQARRGVGLSQRAKPHYLAGLAGCLPRDRTGSTARVPRRRRESVGVHDRNRSGLA